MPSGGGGGGGGAAPGASAVAHPGTRYMSTEHLQALADLKQEIGLLGQLRHPNICLLLGYSLAYDREVMISELMKCSLFDVFKTLRVTAQPMPLRRSLRYAIQFAQGMNYLHTCKPPVLHRDLKPANLLPNPNPNPNPNPYPDPNPNPTPNPNPVPDPNPAPEQDFERRENREPNRADFTMAEPRILGLARRMGELD